MKKGEKLERLIKEHYLGWSLAKFADHAGIKKTTLHDLTKKESLDKVAIENIQAIAKALDMSIEELFFRLDNDLSTKDRIDYKVKEESANYNTYKQASDAIAFKDLKYFGYVSAGKLESVEGLTNADSIKLPTVFLGKHKDRDDLFIMKVNGDSMNRVISNGSLLICLPIEKEELRNNDIVIFEYNGEMSMKRYRTTNENIIFSPDSTNNNFFDVVIPKDTISEVRILAKIISYHVVLD